MTKIFECIVGSHAYGTNIETSDIDIKGVYRQLTSEILGLKYQEQTNPDKDTTYYEVRRFIELAGSANPTILEMLFVDPKFIKVNCRSFRPLLDNRKLFLTKQCANSFGGYAVAQIKKAKGLNKKMNWEKEKTIRKEPIDFCYIQSGQGSIPVKNWLKKDSMLPECCGIQAIDHMPNCYLLYYDFPKQYASQTNSPNYAGYKGFEYKGFGFEDSNDLRLSSIPKEQIGQHAGIFYFNKDAYSIHCKEYNQYQTWLENRNTARYTETQEHGQQVDGKNLMHCMRLINCAIEIGQTGNLTVFRPEAQDLLKIRRGDCILEDVIKEAEEKLLLIDDLFKVADLPDSISLAAKHELLLKCRYQ